MGVLLCLLGLSYGKTSLALVELGVCVSKGSLHEAVQTAKEQCPGLEQMQILAGVRMPSSCNTQTCVKCEGE
jgi:hypothetical protein